MNAPVNEPPALPPKARVRMPLAGRGISLWGWTINTLYSVVAAFIFPVAVVVRGFSGSDEPLVSVKACVPLLIGAGLVFAGNRLAGRQGLRSILEALAALVAPPALVYAVVMLLLRVA